MSNEEIAILIKQGQKELYGELWNNMERWFYKLSNNFYLCNSEQCAAAGVELNDIIQTCFLVLVDTVEAYRPERDLKLITYTKNQCMNRMSALMNGRRGTKHADPLNKGISLYTPMPGKPGNEKEQLLFDTIPDREAEKAFNESETEEQKALHIALKNALKKLSVFQNEIIQKKYFKRNSVRKLDKNEQKEAKRAITELRKDRELLRLGSEYLNLNLYAGTGVTAWKNTQSSSVERLVEKADKTRRNMSSPNEGK